MTMQHYMHIGLGFSAHLLTKDQADAIWSQTPHMPEYETIGLWLIPFTEDYEGKDWATIVVKNYGEIEQAGKMALVSDLTEKAAKFKLSKDEKIFVENKFKEFGISHLISEIKPIIYSENY